MNKFLKEEPAVLLKRLHYRSVHRGCKETDLVFAAFAEHKLAGLDDASLKAYEALLEENDADIWGWLTGKAKPPRADYEPLLAMLRQFPQ